VDTGCTVATVSSKEAHFPAGYTDMTLCDGSLEVTLAVVSHAKTDLSVLDREFGLSVTQFSLLKDESKEHGNTR
jgi:hypothetical protein